MKESRISKMKSVTIYLDDHNDNLVIIGTIQVCRRFKDVILHKCK